MLLSRKLPIAAAVLTVLSIGIASAVSLYIGPKILMDVADDKLSSVAASKRSQVDTYLGYISKELIAASHRRDAPAGIIGFKKVWDAIEGDKTSELQKRYITDNPNEADKKYLLNTAEVDGYDKLHARLHSRFLDFKKTQGYSDILLTDMEGNVLYSVLKMGDFAQNLTNGNDASTGLGRLVNEIIGKQDEDQIVFSDFEKYSPANNQTEAFIGKAVSYNGEIIGTMVFKLSTQGLNTILKDNYGLGDNGEVFVLNSDGFLISGSKLSDGQEPLETKIESKIVISATDRSIETGILPNYKNLETSIGLASTSFHGTKWFVGALIPTKEVTAGAIELRNSIFIAGLLLFGGVMIVAFLFAKSITGPINKICSVMNRLAAGDTNFDVSNEVSDDEIGQMARAVAVFQNAAIEKTQLERNAEDSREADTRQRKLRDVEKQQADEKIEFAVQSMGHALKSFSNGDLSVEIETQFDGVLDALRLDFNEAIHKINATFAAITDGASSLDDKSGGLRNAADTIAERTERQAAALEETATALEQVTRTVEESTQRTKQAAAAVTSAQNDTNKSSQIVGDAMAAMERIEAASGEISQIISLIDEIAFQTNLLALNAGVEAARAGESGAGFAVVAEEVRALAQRSTVAAQEIKQLITKSSQEVSSGVKLVHSSRESLDSVASNVSTINEQVSTIAHSSSEQLVAIQQINAAISEMDTMTQQNAAIAEESTAATNEMSSEITSLSMRINTFKLKNDISQAHYGGDANAA